MSVLSLEQLFEAPFYIEKFLVDAQRNTISINDTVHTIEPKVMQVLLFLTVNNNKVVSQEDLYSEVWPNSVFSPGSIRRCIAILRKIISNEDQDLIKTISKKGYCLNAKVTFKKRTSGITQKIIVGLVTMMVAFIVVFSFSDDKTPPFQVREALPVTSTEDLEFNAKVSPDGAKIAFLRVSKDSLNLRTLWIKELASGKEQIVVNKDIAEFDWSPKSDALAFSTYANHIEQIYLVDINTNGPTHLVTSLEKAHRISSLNWQADKSLLTLTKQHDTVGLIKININTGKIITLKEFNHTFIPYEISVDNTHHQLAIAGFDYQGISQIYSSSLESDNIELTEVVKLDNNRYFLAWHPNGASLVISDGRLLSQVDTNGKISRINYDSYDFVQHPQFTPDGNNILFSLAKIDIDIEQVSLSNCCEPTKLVDSNTVDREAALSPDKSKLAFISQRKGYPQIYILDLATQSTYLVYENKEKLLGVSRPVWHASSKKLGFSNYEFPIVINLENKNYSIKYFSKPHGILTDFYHNSDEILVLSHHANRLQTINLQTEKVTHQQANKTPIAFLDKNEQVCFVKLDTLLCGDNTVNIEGLSTKEHILHWVKSGSELLLTTQSDNDKSLIIVDLSSKKIKAKHTIPSFVTRVLAIKNNNIFYESQYKQKDIVLLHN
ncbi:winged helix-turn-helix domain-containing protein [Thalassotalea sp. G2M2-11]|uniref:winged helix-turn-helix domain-containing protein n=1 Tax=Thalassotalea sp. G2M2-11 TaxID=2787627 RepID=UPI0019D0B071